MLKKLKRALFEKGNVIRFELDDWYKWYQEPEKFHNAVVTYLEKDGKKVETISIITNVTSNKISTLRIDGIKYELSVVVNQPNMGPTQSVKLSKVVEEL
ncbi:hypothetical protein [Fredinandcohnia sp. 179-A 10B2 NHS]|uniref:hypothetical protein n=1 Tax=Fredinandcohnia sp. 179-A 10B2 NHS TaxID=3235176 RepID=UPI0039A36919